MEEIYNEETTTERFLEILEQEIEVLEKESYVSTQKILDNYENLLKKQNINNY